MKHTHDARRSSRAHSDLRLPTTFKATPLLAALILIWPMTPALAQSTDATDATPRVGKLETVTVTAERRSENIKNVPMAITTVSGEKLDILNSGGQDVRFLSARVPSLNIESSFGRAFPRFYVRGLGNSDFDLNASQPVSLIVDDIVQENPILKGFPLFDIERIEVLRGPQGTMFGRNTPAGALRFESVKPGKKLEGYVNASYGTHATTNIEGALNVPVNPEWSARVSLQ